MFEKPIITELLAENADGDVGNQMEIDSSLLQIKRQLYSYACFEKVGSVEERNAWT